VIFIRDRVKRCNYLEYKSFAGRIFEEQRPPSERAVRRDGQVTGAGPEGPMDGCVREARWESGRAYRLEAHGARGGDVATPDPVGDLRRRAFGACPRPRRPCSADSSAAAGRPGLSPRTRPALTLTARRPALRAAAALQPLTGAPGAAGRISTEPGTGRSAARYLISAVPQGRDERSTATAVSRTTGGPEQ
jgi:hypothetical protein